MRTLHHLEELRAALNGHGVAFVPTMGNLHEGHIELVAAAKRTELPVVTSLFVNPLQFGQGEDFERYPRTLQADSAKLADAGCDFIFAPAVDEMYREPQTCLVQPPLANELCGAFRPGHFSGVCTVVLKLFNMVQPRIAIFGKKDYQQLLILKLMTRQFNLPIEIIAAETVRAQDGLALSSRNGYLTAVERAEAPRLYRVLKNIADRLLAGQRDYASLESEGRAHLALHGWKIDYVSIRNAKTLLAPGPDTQFFVVLGAAHLGKTRLIDNLEVTSAS